MTDFPRENESSAGEPEVSSDHRAAAGAPDSDHPDAGDADREAPLDSEGDASGVDASQPDAWDSALRHAYAAAEGQAPSLLMQSIHLRAGRKVQVALRDLGTDARPLRLQRRSVDWAGGGEGRYRPLGELARGGVGVVLLAHDHDLGRDVAVKVLHEEHADDASMLQRFVEEAQIGGQLQHPGIVPVYELGLDLRQRPYFTMKLVQGETLAARLDARPDPGEDLPRLLSVFARVCETIAYAHARGVVHRDVKPGNVMVGEFGEVLVMDWGFAKVLGRGDAAATAGSVATTSDSSVSIAGTVLGTPAYMPPEQAAGEIQTLDARADVFALGAILCQILTGRPPYIGDDLLAQARAGMLEPAYARLSACGADPALCALAEQCLQRTPAARPSSATAVSEAVAHYFATVDARADTARIEAAAAEARVIEERKRRRLTVALGLTALAFVVAAAVFYVAYRRRVESTTREVSAALGQAWQRVAAGDLAAAAVAVEQARTALRAGTPDAVTAAAVEDAAGRVTRLQRNAAIELSVLKALLPGGGPEGRPMLVEVADALRAADIDVGASPLDLAARVRAVDPEVQPTLLRALQELAFMAAVSANTARVQPAAVLAALDELDADAERVRVRAAWAAHDMAALRVQRAALDVEATPAETLELVGLALLAEGAQTDGIASLAAAHGHAPDNFWINERLAQLYRQVERHEDSHLHRELAMMAHPLARFGVDPRPLGPGRGGRGRGPRPGALGAPPQGSGPGSSPRRRGR
ncbi:MAG: serine/threonine-protein kinase [Planctomycetota bacterium]